VTRKRLTGGVAAVGAAAVALVLAACGSSSGTTAAATTDAKTVPQLAAGQKVSLTFESYNLAQPGPWTDTFNALIKDFEAKYPNITVTAQKPQVSTQSGFGSASTQSIQTEVAAGNGPDVGQLTFGDLAYAAKALGAQPLDDVVGKAAVQANFGGTHPFAASARTLGDVGGKTYGVPFVFSTPVLYYNASLFQAAGLDPSKPPTTWAEFKTDALAIKAKTGKDGGYLDCLTKVSGDWCYQALVASNGGSVISSDSSKLTFADAPAVGAVNMAADLVTSGASPKLTQAQAFPEFTRGDMGMILESSSVQSQFIKGAAGGNWTLKDAAMPSFDGKTVQPTNSGAALFMFSKDPAKQRAAWDLMQYLTSPQAYTMIAEDIGYLPLRTGLVNDPSGLQSWAKQNGKLLQVNLDQLANIKQPWVAFPGNDYKQIQDDMMNAVQSVVFNNANPTSTLTAAQKAATALLPS
jgi:multiple sugar transport system substrate-binding protein